MTYLRQMLLRVVLVLASMALHAAQAQNCYERAVSLRLKPLSEGPPFSFLHEAGRGGAVMRSRKLPRTIVQVLDSNGDVDASVSMVRVVVSSNVRLSSDGTTATTFRGEAVFDSIVIDDVAPSMALTFTAIAEAPLEKARVQGARVSTGNFTVLERAVDTFALAFRQNNSLFLRENASATVVLGVSLPPIRVRLLNSEYAMLPTEAILGTNFTVEASMGALPDNTPITLSNARAVLYDGEAVFSALTIVSATSLTVLPPLVFTLVGSPSLVVRTGPLAVSSRQDYAHIAFLGEGRSFVYGQGVSLFATSNVALPPIRIALVDTTYSTSPAATGLVITASCNRAQLAGNVVGAVDGIATFDNLQFTDVEDTVFRQLSITFTAGNQGALPLAGDVLRTGTIYVRRDVVAATSMRFLQSPYDSFVNAEGEPKQVIFLLRLPAIRIALLSSNNVPDTTTPMVVVATTTRGSRLTSGASSVAFRSGVAVFDSLEFTTADATLAPRLTFTAFNDNTAPVFTLRTGIINVTTIQKNANLRFQPYGVSLFTQEGVAATATIGVPMPPVIVELVTSAGTADYSSSDVGITATADGAELTNSFLRVTSGVAMFTGLTFVSEVPGDFVLTFTAGSEGGNVVAGKALVTGKVSVAGALTPAFSLAFAPSSYIRFVGEVAPVTQGAVIPSITILVLDSVGTLDPDATGIVIDVRSSSGVLGGSLSRPVVGGSARFEDLVIQNAFDPVLTFCAASGAASALPVDGRCLQTGSLTFSQVTGSVGRLTLLNATQAGVPVVLAREGMNVSVEAGALLPVAVAVADTTGRFTPGPISAVITVQADSNVKLLPPLTQRVDATTGIAYFAALQFASEVPAGVLPIITFTASVDTTQGGSTARLLPISSGLIAVSGATGLTGVDVTAEVLANYRSFDFTQWRVDMCARFNIEVDRLILLRSDVGTGIDPSPTGVTEDTVGITAAGWFGTRLDLRVLDPLPASRNNVKAAAVAAAMVNLQPDCASDSLRLRRIYLSADDGACDFGVFDEQQNAARQCIETQGKVGYCGCYVPMFARIGRQCMGYAVLTTLCIDTLINQAGCTQTAIRDVCNQLVFGDVPRAPLAGTGLLLLLFVPPLAYVHWSGFFARLSRPNTKYSHIPHEDTVFGDDI